LEETYQILKDKRSLCYGTRLSGHASCVYSYTS
jgi:hypothetical protein